MKEYLRTVENEYKQKTIQSKEHETML